MKPRHQILLFLIAIVGCLASAPKGLAHCDALDGPVIEAAKVALIREDVTPVLKWVRKEAEDEVRQAFILAVRVRSLGDDARHLADAHFFETLVRLHRAGEGASFNGLKPPGSIAPELAAADKALEAGDLSEVSAHLTRLFQKGLQERFIDVLEKKKHADKSVDAGRAYVATYVAYAHYVEAAFALALDNTAKRLHEHAAENHEK